MERRATTFVILLYNFLTVVTSYICLQCDDVPLPNLCEEIGECGPHELCAVEQSVTTAGVFRYRQSCMDKLKCGTVVHSGLGKRTDLLTCTECCEGDLCNAAGCGEKGFDMTLGPICYRCALQIGTETCSKIQQCGRDQDCSIHPVRRIGAPDNLFETKCTERKICDVHDETGPSLIVGRKRSTCSICCNNTLCNDFDSRPCVPLSPTVTASISTKMTTSPTTEITSKRTTTSPTTEITSTKQATVKRTVTTNSFTTAPITQQVCEDVPDKICYESMCKVLNEHVLVNCRRKCNLCGKSTEALARSSTPSTANTIAAATISMSTPIIPTTTVTSTTASTTSNTGITGHTHGSFCFDNAQGCDTFVHFCTLDEFKQWTKDNCKRSCNYC